MTTLMIAGSVLAGVSLGFLMGWLAGWSSGCQEGRKQVIAERVRNLKEDLTGIPKGGN